MTTISCEIVSFAVIFFHILKQKYALPIIYPNIEYINKCERSKRKTILSIHSYKTKTKSIKKYSIGRIGRTT